MWQSYYVFCLFDDGRFGHIDDKLCPISSQLRSHVYVHPIVTYVYIHSCVIIIVYCLSYVAK